jgi:hypothetical protein
MISHTFDNQSRNSKLVEQRNRSLSRTPRAHTKDANLSYKALMELKGSKCTCVHSIYM